MSDSEWNNFDDPELRTLLKRAGEKHRASDELRARAERVLSGQIVGRIDGTQSTETPVYPFKRVIELRRWVFRIAALILVGVGLVFVVIRLNERHELNEQAQYVAENRSLIDAMLAHQPDGKSLSLPADFDAITQAQHLSNQVGIKVRIAELTSHGYQLREASVVLLGDVPAARMTYVDSMGKSISIFQLPFNAFQKVDAGDIYSLKTDRQLVAGNVDEDGVRCIVTDSDFETERAFSILEHFRS